MVKTTIIIQAEDENNVYKIGDRVRVKMKPSNPERQDWFNEYIGDIVNITPASIIIDVGVDKRDLFACNIEKMRFAEKGETFNNRWDF